MPSKAALLALESIQAEQAKELPQNEIDELIEKARSRVARMTDREESIINDETADEILRFDRRELVIGGKLGLGGFCLASEISKIDIPLTNPTPPLHSREIMSMQCIREEGGPRYAIKELSAQTKSDKSQFDRGMADIVIEAKLLSVLQHDNIIKIRGLAACGFFHKDFFIVMDRLNITLDKQIIQWKEKENECSLFCCLSSKRREKREENFEDRVVTAMLIARAMAYLHSKNIIYRDLKPENIGFDVRGIVKLFDFGLATIVGPSRAVAGDNGTYYLTSFTGSPLYMAPENFKGLPYNLSADVYSFGILLWHIIAMKTPFEKLTKDTLEQFVVQGTFRPAIQDDWSRNLSGLMKSCWDANFRSRPKFDEIEKRLLQEGEEIVVAGTNTLDISTRSYNDLLTKLNSRRK